MRLTLHYGRQGLPIALPDAWEIAVLRKPVMPVITDPARALAAALAHPTGGPALGKLAAGKRSACILICDITRPVPNGLLLPGLIATLEEAGIPRERITILVATGLHRPNEGAELRELIHNDQVYASVRVCNHFARHDADHVDLGHTRRGTPVKIDRRFVEADVRIVTGLVEPHFMAGYSGGRKLITPGIAHADTITAFHSAAFLEDPSARNCQLHGNPLHAEQLEIAGKLGEIFAVNVVLDEARRLACLTAGALEASHYAAIAFLEQYAVLQMTETFPTVVTTAAGYPLDATYYQAIKGLVGAYEILAPGGTILLAAECAAGLGSPEFVAAQQRLLAAGPEAFCAGLHGKAHAEIDEWQTEMLCKVLHVGQVALFAGGLTPADRQLTGVPTVESLEHAIHQRVAACGDTRMAIIPEGPYVIPVCRTAAITPAS